MKNPLTGMNAAVDIELFSFHLFYSSLLFTELYVNGFCSCSNLKKNIS